MNATSDRRPAPKATLNDTIKLLFNQLLHFRMYLKLRWKDKHRGNGEQIYVQNRTDERVRGGVGEGGGGGGDRWTE